MLLNVENLAFAYQQKLLFKNLSFTVNPGQILHIQGENGVGKSTLLAITAGLIKCRQGKVIYSNTINAVDYRGHIEYLPAEGNGLYLKLSAIENLKFYLKLKAVDANEDRILAELNSWGLKDPFVINHLTVEKFSTGMKRRLALARIFLSAAKFWLLDEPLFGLDNIALEIFRKKLIVHQNNNGSVIIISHDQSTLHGISSETLLLGKYAS